FSYQPNDRKRKVADTRLPRSAYGLPERAFVYCCTNHTHKITAETFKLWLRILAREQGSAPARLVFAPGMANAEHLARLAHADLFLDTLPYNAHSSASDALWV